MRKTILFLSVLAIASSSAGAAKQPSCRNAKGQFAACPKAAVSPAPAGATGLCKDGTYTMSKTHSGACSHHGGVSKWL